MFGKKTAILMIVTAVLFAAVLMASDTAREQTLQKAIELLESKGDLTHAMPLFEEVAKSPDRALAARGLLYLAEAQQRQGSEHARTTYARIVKEFGNQAEAVAEARKRLAVLGNIHSEDIPTAHLVSTGDDADSGAFISPDGRLLSRPDWSSGDLAIRDMSTGQTRRLMAKVGGWESDEEVDAALISPDLKRIAFLWLTSEGKEQLRIMPNEPGAKSSLLVDNSENDVGPVAWSPDSKSILVTLGHSDKTWQLAWVSAANGTVIPLKSLDWRFRGDRPSLSPDGKYIAYSALATNPGKALNPYNPLSSSDSPDQYLYILAVDGSGETELVKGNSINESPVWTPDGHRILFVSNRSGSFTLWSVAVRDGKPAPSGPSPAMADTGRISPIAMTESGSYYYVKKSLLHTQTGQAVYPFDLFMADLDAAGKIRSRAVRLLDNFVDANKDPSWSPDGKSIAFLRRRPGNDSNVFDQIVVRSLESGKEKVFTRNAAVTSASWFHNGENLLVLNGNSLFRLDLKTGEFQSIEAITHIALPPGIGAVAISPDDTTVYMMLRDSKDGTGSVVAFDLKTGDQKQVWISKTRGTSIRDIALSPDGHGFALTLNHGPLVRMNVDGTGYRELYPSTDRGMLAWSPDSQGIFFLAPDSAGHTQLMRWNSESGRAELTGLQITQVGHPAALSPDGSKIIFSDITESNELWEIENLPSIWGNAR